jgi:hypothetical protein
MGPSIVDMVGKHSIPDQNPADHMARQIYQEVNAFVRGLEKGYGVSARLFVAGCVEEIRLTHVGSRGSRHVILYGGNPKGYAVTIMLPYDCIELVLTAIPCDDAVKCTVGFVAQSEESSESAA